MTGSVDMCAICRPPASSTISIFSGFLRRLPWRWPPQSFSSGHSIEVVFQTSQSSGRLIEKRYPIDCACAPPGAGFQHIARRASRCVYFQIRLSPWLGFLALLTWPPGPMQCEMVRRYGPGRWVRRYLVSAKRQRRACEEMLILGIIIAFPNQVGP